MTPNLDVRVITDSTAMYYRRGGGSPRPDPPASLPRGVARKEGLMSRPTRCITIAVVSLAVAAPAASAMVVDPLPTSGTATPTQDLRNPDQRVPQQSVADMHASTAIAAHQAQPSPPKSSDDGISPLVYVLPS